MAFKLTQVMVDVLTDRAIVTAAEAGGTSHKSVQIQFPFKPPAAEGKEQALAVAEAKKVLQQALNEI